jgi:hypothetical protein
MKRAWITTVVVTLSMVGMACAQQLEELFSQYVQVKNPTGLFVQRLIKVQPGGGDGWKAVSLPEVGLKLRLPAAITPDVKPNGSRVLLATFAEGDARPRPALRIDVFTPQPDEPSLVDPEYAKEYAEAYPEQAFKGRFTVTDSGMVVLQKLPLAMVGGTYQAGAAAAYRLQWSYLSKERQYFLTFDCPEGEWANYADSVARILLSVELPKRKKE